MPFTKSPRLTTGLSARRRWLLALTLVWLTGCALTHPKKPVSHADKFSCGEHIPKASPR